MATAKKARYSDEKNPLFKDYPKLLAREKSTSPILNTELSGATHHAGIITWNKEGIIRLMRTIKGDETGRYQDNNEFKVAVIPVLSRRLESLAEEYQAHLTSCRNEGKDSAGYPSEMLGKRLKTEAKLDVAEMEILELQKRLDKLARSDAQESENKMLEFGPRGWGKFHGLARGVPEHMINVLKTMDGQECGFINDTMCITDSRSPYAGMALTDYRKWLSQLSLLRSAAYETKLAVLQEEAVKNGDDKPFEVPFGLAPQRVTKAQLPKWPSWAKKHTKHTK